MEGASPYLQPSQHCIPMAEKGLLLLPLPSFRSQAVGEQFDYYVPHSPPAFRVDALAMVEGLRSNAPFPSFLSCHWHLNDWGGQRSVASITSLLPFSSSKPLLGELLRALGTDNYSLFWVFLASTSSHWSPPKFLELFCVYRALIRGHSQDFSVVGHGESWRGLGEGAA